MLLGDGACYVSKGLCLLVRRPSDCCGNPRMNLSEVTTGLSDGEEWTDERWDKRSEGLVHGLRHGLVGWEHQMIGPRGGVLASSFI